jgi:chromosome segregation ATPase
MKNIVELYQQFSVASQEIASTVNHQDKLLNDIEILLDKTKDIYKLNSDAFEDLDKFQSEVLKIIQNISSDNNKLYLDYQNFTNSRLELMKSDLSLEIRNSISSLEKALNSIKKELDNSLNGLRGKCDNILKEFKITKIIGSLSIIFNIIILIILFWKK